MEKAKLSAGRPPKLNLSCKDIVDIIKCASEHGVSDISFGDLHVRYQARSSEKYETPLGEGRQPTIKEVEEQEQVAHFEVEKELKDEELANLAISDPVQFESLMASGDLTERLNDTENDSI